MAFGLNQRFLDDLSAFEDRVRPTFQAAEQDLTAALGTMRPDLAALEDDLRARMDALQPQLEDAGDRLAAVFDDPAIRDALARLGLDDISVDGLDDLESLVARMPPGLSGPDATGEVPTGSADIPRELAAVAASLAAAPRVVQALGPDSAFVDVRGRSFAVVETYRDDASGFSALRLAPVEGGGEVFAVDGLQVGSRADEVAAATLGRLQVESAAFAEMIADAAAAGAKGGVLLTGPSLGGAVAQVAALETAQALLAGGSPVPTGTVQLVTVDSLGGRDAAAAINGGTLDPAALEVITALNLRTDGDIVTRIGSHIGATKTLPALDEAGNPVELNAADAHVNVVSLLQTLDSDALFAAGTLGAPQEIAGFALASNAASQQVIEAWLASGAEDDFDAPTLATLQIPGDARFDASRTVWSLDADENGTTDIAVRLSAPSSQADVLIG
ncbi:hypothetical protein [Falsiroseomonas oryzae]|uniref:hypothetical protein n=1 Tax=Falsiroseomonas oryzae TaxID=2766473 RepID=UPI0022EA9969|nr:hypothetical protein [Roseomonas sp. MO-31]